MCLCWLCYSIPFGIVYNFVSIFPDITNFQIIKYVEPEYRFNVVMPNDDKHEVVIPNTKLMTTQKEVLNLIWEQTGVYFEPLKPKDYRSKLNEWRGVGCETIYPPKGTQISDRLREELYQYCINGPQAKQRGQIKNGACFTEDSFHYFKIN